MCLLKTEPSYTAGGNTKWCRHLGRQSGVPHTNKQESPRDPATLLPGLYSREMKTCPQKNFQTKFTAALFKIAKKWKQPKWPLTDKRTNKMWYIHSIQHYSAIKIMKYCYML